MESCGFDRHYCVYLSLRVNNRTKTTFKLVWGLRPVASKKGLRYYIEDYSRVTQLFFYEKLIKAFLSIS